jgi:hypothetical protein
VSVTLRPLDVEPLVAAAIRISDQEIVLPPIEKNRSSPRQHLLVRHQPAIQKNFPCIVGFHEKAVAIASGRKKHTSPLGGEGPSLETPRHGANGAGRWRAQIRGGGG